jgi:XrtN system VIT domain protein
MFPFNLVKDAETSLVITKSTKYSPTLKDMKESAFGDSLATQLKGAKAIKLFNMGDRFSPYLRTLKEHRVFEFEQGDIAALKQLLTTNTFAHSVENDNQVVVDNAEVLLVRNNDSTAASGPDHLMRLFAYNHVMTRLKSDLFPGKEPDSTMVSEAEQAYIVTPVSSLIVLETQEDYDRFKIAKSDNTLGNASLKSNGAVPEPHEWALIILAVLSLAWIMYRERIKRLIRN